MEQTRLNAYRIMWLFVYFDLPVKEKKERKIASKFRQFLLNDGYTMMQFSVYTRHCGSREVADKHIKRVEAMIPEHGHINILSITDKQYGNMLNYWGVAAKPMNKAPVQLEIF